MNAGAAPGAHLAARARLMRDVSARVFEALAHATGMGLMLGIAVIATPATIGNGGASAVLLAANLIVGGVEYARLSALAREPARAPSIAPAWHALRVPIMALGACGFGVGLGAGMLGIAWPQIASVAVAGFGLQPDGDDARRLSSARRTPDPGSRCNDEPRLGTNGAAPYPL